MRSNSAGGGEEVETEEEEFYESLDRILSSSCSSTSASDDDADVPRPHRHHRNGGYAHLRREVSARFQAFSTMYDVWRTEPSSVEERRRRLLQKLGLIGDPALSREPRGGLQEATEGGTDDDAGGGGENGGRERQGEMGRSVSCDDGLCRREDQQRRDPSSAFVRSRSDSSVDPIAPFRHPPCPNSLAPSPALVHNNHHLHSPNKPPLAKFASSGTDSANDVDEDDSDGHDGEGICCENNHPDDQYCTIRNLDNGDEFVVKELREDGMWEKLREVGTGRQLTMEEFQITVIGHSPIVHELMRRQNEESGNGHGGKKDGANGNGGGGGFGSRSKKRGSWLRSIRNMAGTVVNRTERRSSDERDTSSEKGGRRSSSATDDSQDVHSHHGSERVRVRQYGKSSKDLTGLYMNQEIQAHYGSIWSIKFSLDGRYLASAGEDRIIRVWQVVELERKKDLFAEKGIGIVEKGNCPIPFAAGSNDSPEPASVPSNLERDNSEKKRRTKVPASRKSFSFDPVVVPDYVFALSEKPICSFSGHQKDVLDLSWSKSEHLLSSSMDKTVKLWDMCSNSCLKTFSHSDYVTCIQFNPVDDNYFISGSLDSKVRLWSIKDRQVVDWNDLHEMVTAASYTPDGQGALVGSHKGNCNFYNTSGHRLQQKKQVNLQNKKKKSHYKKITGFEFASGSSAEVLVTSADSRIRVVDNFDLVHKFKGFRNTSSQISASITPDGKHVVCASEDSHVYVWRYDAGSRAGGNKGVITVTQSYEHFHCRDVSVAVTWPGSSTCGMLRTNSISQNEEDALSMPDTSMLAEIANGQPPLSPAYKCNSSPLNPTHSTSSTNLFYDHASATWPEEKLVVANGRRSPSNNGVLNSEVQSRSAWGMVIVTAGRGGVIRTYQNFGYPVRV